MLPRRLVRLLGLAGTLLAKPVMEAGPVIPPLGEPGLAIDAAMVAIEAGPVIALVSEPQLDRLSSPVDSRPPVLHPVDSRPAGED